MDIGEDVKLILIYREQYEKLHRQGSSAKRAVTIAAMELMLDKLKAHGWVHRGKGVFETTYDNAFITIQ